MSIVSTFTPSPSHSSSALPFVRFVVPNPGMVYTLMPRLGSPSILNASTATSRHSAESSPPESPMVTDFTPMRSSLIANVTARMRNTRSGGQQSRNGCGEM